MAYPAIVDYAISNDGNTKTPNLDYPATVNAGNLILAAICNDNDQGGGLPSDLESTGWTIIQSYAGAAIAFALVARISTDGSEAGGSFNLTTDAGTVGEVTGAVVMSISGWYSSGTINDAITAVTPIYDPSGLDVNPPSHTASWGAGDNLWGIALGLDTSQTVSSYCDSPTVGDGLVVLGQSATGSAAGSAAVAVYPWSGGDTLDPTEASSGTTGGAKILTTFVIRPASGGTSVAPLAMGAYSRMHNG